MKTSLCSIVVSCSLVLAVTTRADSYTVTCVPNGYTAIANQLRIGGNTLDEVLPLMPDGTRLSKWTCQWLWVIYTYETGLGGWVDGPGNSVGNTVTLAPGEGAMLYNPLATPLSITFAGSPNIPALPYLQCGCWNVAPTNQPAQYFSFMSRQTKGIGTFENITGLAPELNAVVLRWDPATQAWVAHVWLEDPINLWDPVLPVMGIGEPAMIRAPCFGLADLSKCEQPPAPTTPTNIFYGWNEPSMHDPPGPTVADDWVCTTTNPVTKIRWWGSFLGWNQSSLPPGMPVAFKLTFWTDVPALPPKGFSHPGTAIHQITCSNFTAQFAGWDYDPRSQMIEACFLFEQTLTPNEYFHQEPGPTGTNIFWLSVGAVYNPSQMGPMWGWKTRPRAPDSPAPDDAVVILEPPSMLIVPGATYANGNPIFWPTPTNSWDVAFELISGAEGGDFKWYQPPDFRMSGQGIPLGMDVDATYVPSWTTNLLADDFLCTETGPLTNISIWASWRNDQFPAYPPTNVTFTLSIHQDFPSPNQYGYSMPGQAVWWRTFTPLQFKCTQVTTNTPEGWFTPPNQYLPFGDNTCFRYDFSIPTGAFVQQGTPQNPIVYWLDVQARVVGTGQWLFGWKTSITNWNDDACHVNALEPFNGPVGGPAKAWNRLTYPPGHLFEMDTLDLAFRLNYHESGVREVKWSQPPVLYAPTNAFNGWNEFSVRGSTQIAADDWVCTSASPVTDIVWWGSFIGWSVASPPQLPAAFQIAIWKDFPKQGTNFSHPDVCLHTVVCTNYTWQFAGWDIDPRTPNAPPETCFKFGVVLQTNEWFRQAVGTNIYWISIAAIYPTGQIPANPWGWKTRPRDLASPAPDDAVRIYSPTAPVTGMLYQSGMDIWWPSSANSWDLAFEIGTEDLGPAMDFGDAPDPTYPTLRVNDGARHVIVPGFMVGNLIDAEPDGQPNAAATGDNLANLPDEDGVIIPTLVPGQTIIAQVTASGPGVLQGWIDFGCDGSWAQPGDQIFTNVPVLPGPNNLPFMVPATTPWSSNTCARFRFSTVSNLTFTGMAPDGEVEDYRMLTEDLPQHDLGDAPDSSNNAGANMTAYPGGGPPGVLANFPTVFGGVGGPAPFGPIHMRPWTAAHLGTSVTGEWEADVNWDQDVINNLTPPLDLPDRDGADDGVLFPLTLAHCRSNVMLYTYRVVAPVVSVMFVNVWFDWNRDGDWDDTMVCGNGSAAPEWVVQNQLVFLTAPGLYTNSTPGFRAWHPAAGNQPGWMRITFSETMVPGPLGFNGRGGDGPKVGYQYGETEDYYVTAYAENGELDFSDAPDPTYPTMLPAGARHQIVPGFQLGPLVDAETNGLPHPQALGDDSSNLPDEDGVQIRAPWLTGTQACVNVSLISGPLGGRLDAWLDFNRNGSWDGGEQIFANAPLVPGVNPLCFAIPCNASLGTNFARFRLTSNGGVGPGGAARDGEVEDYLVFIQQPRPTNSVSITNITVTNLVVSGTNYQVASLWWNAQSCIQYQLEQTLSLGTNGGTNIAWTPAGSVVIGPANSQTVTNLAQPATQRYYRIVVP